MSDTSQEHPGTRTPKHAPVPTEDHLSNLKAGDRIVVADKVERLLCPEGLIHTSVQADQINTWRDAKYYIRHMHDHSRLWDREFLRRVIPFLARTLEEYATTIWSRST